MLLSKGKGIKIEFKKGAFGNTNFKLKRITHQTPISDPIIRSEC